MKLIYSLVLISFVLIMLNSCEYEPNSKNIKEIQKITLAPTLSVNLNLQSDTLFFLLGNSQSLIFNSKDTLIKTIEIYFDDTLCNKTSNISGSYFISKTGKENSRHVLKFKFYRRSGSGSIADNMGAEGFLYSKEWVVVFKNYNSIQSNINKFIPTDGSLKIFWNRYKGVGFQKYIVTHYYSDGKNDTIAITSDIDKLSCFDSSFVGNKLEYKVDVVTDNGTIYGNISFFSDQLPEASVLTNVDGKFLIAWGKNKYFNNIKQYDIYETFQTFWDKVYKIATLTSITDTQYIYLNSKIGVVTKFYINPVPKINPRPIKDFIYELKEKSSSTNELTLGDKLLFIDNFISTPLGIYNYFSSYNGIYKYNTLTKLSEKSSLENSSKMVSSYDGEMLLAYSNGDFLLYSANKMEIIARKSQKVISGNDWNADNFFTQSILSVSNNGIGVFYNNVLYVYDFINDKLLESFKPNDFVLPISLKISPQGDYLGMIYYSGSFAVNAQLVSISNGTNKLIVKTQMDYFDFDPINNDRFIYFSNNNLIVKSLNSSETIKDLSIKAFKMSSIDFNNNEALVIATEKDRIEIIDISNGKLKLSIPTYCYSDNDFINNYFLSNKTIFVNGSYLDGTYKLQLKY
jgi:hypothetical protein